MELTLRMYQHLCQQILFPEKVLLFSYQYCDSHVCPVNLVHAKYFICDSYYCVFIRKAVEGILAFGQITANCVN